VNIPDAIVERIAPIIHQLHGYSMEDWPPDWDTYADKCRMEARLVLQAVLSDPRGLAEALGGEVLPASHGFQWRNAESGETKQFKPGTYVVIPVEDGGVS
jgi:hypothetical protein